MKSLGQVLSVSGNATGEGGQDTVQRALESIRTHLGMSVAYVSEFVDGKSVYRAVDAPGLEDKLKPGDEKPLDDVFCRHILDGRLPELMPDVAAIPFAMTIPIMREVPIGSHVSVPIRLEDGEVYGMFCCLSFEANPSLNARDLQMVRVLADIAGHQIGRDVFATRQRSEVTGRIRAVIDREAFSIVYQPIWDFHRAEPIGFECLCRFSGEPYRTPDKWFAEAVAAGLDTELELAVIHKALAGAASLPRGVYISVNASPDLILSGKLVSVVSAHPGMRIVVEVTEHAQVADYAALRSALADMRAAGASLAVDDAGAGYSSLQHIIQLNPDIIKLDISLTRAVDSDPARRALISALIFFARETGCLMIAEGVETEAERDILKLLGISKGQGYLMGRPMALEAAVSLFAPLQAAVA
jgi:EAL domain-containing protein (putative c-di-GMP-specific phosphodiesterase class I)